MNTYYCVTSRFDDRGHVSVNLHDLKAEEKPKDTVKELEDCDVYCDYFDSQSEAEKFMAENHI